MSETGARRAVVPLRLQAPPSTTADGFGVMFRRLWRRHTAAVGLILVLVTLILAAIPGVFATHDPTAINLRLNSAPPSAENFFGTDNLGRDVFSRVIHGTWITVSVALSSTAISVVLGTLLGLLSGYFGGVVERVILALTDAGMAIPTLFLALVIIAVLGPGLSNLVLAIALSGLPRYIYLVRPQVIMLSKSEFVTAAHGLGAPALHILWRHVLPNLMSSLIVLTSSRIAQAILIESSLNFLGLGVPPPTPTWGKMIAEGRTYLTTAPWYPLAPGVFIMLAVLGFNLIGDGLRDVLDPRLKHERA